MPMRIDPTRLPPGQARAVAIVLAVVALALGYFVLLHWWFVAPMLRVNDEMRDLQALHARYAAAIKAQPELERRVAALDRGGARMGAFLAADDASAASADLLQRVTDVVNDHAHEGTGCSMPSKMPIENTAGKEPFRRVSISISLDCGMQPLVAVLDDFDRSRPYLFVDNLALARSPNGRVQAQLTLSGYLRPTAAP